MVQKTVNAESKAGLRSSTMVRDSDIRCPRGHCSFNSTAAKVQTQGTKDSQAEELKLKKTRPAPSRSKASKPSEQACKEKKKKGTRKDETRISIRPRLIPSTQRRSNKKRRRRPETEMSVRSRVSTVIRKTTMPASAPNLQKTSVGLGNFRAGD